MKTALFILSLTLCVSQSGSYFAVTPRAHSV